MVVGSEVVLGLVETRSNSCIVLFHGAEHLPVADHYQGIREGEGAIEPSVERVNGSWTGHPPPAQQIPWAEEEVVQRQEIGEAVDEQRYNPNGSN